MTGGDLEVPCMLEVVGNMVERQLSKRSEQENKVRQISEKNRTFFTP